MALHTGAEEHRACIGPDARAPSSRMAHAMAIHVRVAQHFQHRGGDAQRGSALCAREVRQHYCIRVLIRKARDSIAGCRASMHEPSMFVLLCHINNFLSLYVCPAQRPRARWLLLGYFTDDDLMIHVNRRTSRPVRMSLRSVHSNLLRASDRSDVRGGPRPSGRRAGSRQRNSTILSTARERPSQASKARSSADGGRSLGK